MSIVLTHQVEASEKSALELAERVRAEDRRRACLRDEVRILMRTLVELHSGVNDNVERWQDHLAEERTERRAEIEAFGTEWQPLYRKLGGVFERTMKLIGSLEDRGQEFDDKVEFLTSWRDLRSTLCFSQEQVAAGAEQVRRGETRPLGEVVSELWDRPVD